MMIQSAGGPTQSELREQIRDVTRRALDSAVRRAYRDAVAGFDVDAGGDIQLFGFTVFKYVEHRVRELSCAHPELGIELLSHTGGAFRFRIGAFVLTPYSCGRIAPADPWKSFPGNDRGAGLLAVLNSGQLNLFPTAEEHLTGIVLAHYGNPTSGFAGTFLKKPIAQSAGQIVSWEHVEALVSTGEMSPVASSPGTESVLPAPSIVQRPTVLPFRRPAGLETESDSA